MSLFGVIRDAITGTPAQVNASGQLKVVLDGKIDTNNTTTALLGAGATFTGTATEILDYAVAYVNVHADEASATDGLSVQQSIDGVNWDFTDEYTILANAGKTFSFQCAGKYMRLVYTNGGTIQTHFDLSLALKKGNGKPSSHRIQDAIVEEDDAELVKAVITGKNASGAYSDVEVNDTGALSVADFLIDIIRGRHPGYYYDTKFGRNPEIDTNTDPEDVWNGGANYTGFDATANENLETFSSSTADVGSLIDSGTSTGGSATTLVDSGATFVTTGVAVGDLIINDTEVFHGKVTVVDSETQLTVAMFHDGDTESHSFSAGESYRIARATGTGAAVVKWLKVLDEDYAEQTDVYVILNGTTGVSTTGNFFRLTRGRVTLVGSNDYNVGGITARQATTTANIFAVLPVGTNSTAIAADTVPAGKTRVILQLYSSMSRLNGAAGSANVRFQTRRVGDVFQTRVNDEITTSAPFDAEGLEGKLLPEKTDMKWRVAFVSDNGTTVNALFRYIDIDNTLP